MPRKQFGSIYIEYHDSIKVGKRFVSQLFLDTTVHIAETHNMYRENPGQRQYCDTWQTVARYCWNTFHSIQWDNQLKTMNEQPLALGLAELDLIYE